MRWLSLGLVNPIIEDRVIANRLIALVIFMAAAVLPLYGQELKTPDKKQAPQWTTEPYLQSFEQENVQSLVKNVESLEEVERSRSFPGTWQDNADETTSSCFALSAGGTPALPANQTTNKPFVFPTRRERFNRYVKSTVGPFRLLRVGLSAGINQWRDNPEEWEQGASGYGKRYASSFGRNVIQQTVIYGLDSAMGLDTGFRRSTRTGFFPRMKDALAENITSRTRTGKRVISVPRISGVYASKIISYETWYPDRYSYKDGLRSGTKSLLTGFAINLVREFVIKW